MPDPRMDKLANVLVHYSAAVRPGETVHLLGPPDTEALVSGLRREIVRAGALTSDQLPLTAAEVVLFVIGKHSTSAQYAADTHLRGRLFEGSGVRWVATLFPGAVAGDLVYRAGKIDSADPIAAWREAAAQQERLIERLTQARELHFRTAAGTDLRVGVEGRAWVNGAGQHNFPDGEVYTAPLEDAVEGIGCFDIAAEHAGRRIENARLVFRAGRIVEASAATGEELLWQLLARDEGAAALGEVALGCNYALTHPTGRLLLDEKMGGTFHIALGASYPETGGRNRSLLHQDLVADLRRGGSVAADGELLCRNGRFFDPTWPS